MSRGKQLRTKVKEALVEASLVQEAIRLGSLRAEQKIHEKKSALDIARQHIGKMIDRTDPIDLLTVLGFFAKYYVIDKHQPIVAFMEATLDTALLKSKTEAGTLAVIAHVALTEIPNIANMIDLATGGTGTVWEDFLYVIGLGSPRSGNVPSGTLTNPPTEGAGTNKGGVG